MSACVKEFWKSVTILGAAKKTTQHLKCDFFFKNASAADNPIYSVFGSRTGISRSADFNGANSGLTKFNRYVGENNARGVIGLVTI